MNEEMNNQEAMELTQEEEEELERCDGELNPASLVLTAVVGGLSVIGGVTVGKMIYEKTLKPGFNKAKNAIGAKISEAKAKKALKQSEEDLEIVEDDEE
mgnify:FL=1|nr:MAG TPA: hypothetical protein [Caudoviricetes sp.]